MALGSSLSIREVGERAAQFKALIAAGSAEVDAGKLESIDTAGLQLLLAAGCRAAPWADAAAARRRKPQQRCRQLTRPGRSPGRLSGDTSVSAGENPARAAAAPP